MERTIAWQFACPSDDVTVDNPKALAIAGREIGVFRTESGLFAVDNICSHEFAYLTKGWIESDIVECPLHEARFCLKTGACLSGPTTVPVESFAVREANGSIEVGMPA